MEILVDKLNYVWPFLAVITPVVFFHELGHYLVARINGVRVEIFSIGFGPELFGINDSHGTRWRFSALPLGGYVKFHGDANVASTTPGEESETAGDEDAFHNKNVAQRSAIAFAGPFANLLLAAVIFAVFFSVVGERYTPVEIGVVAPGSPAEAAGLKPGDRIERLNGSEVDRFEDLQFALLRNLAEPMDLTVSRDGQVLELRVVPTLMERTDDFGRAHEFGDIGVRPFLPAKIDQLVIGDPAEQGGMLPGDNIILVDGIPIDSFSKLREVVEKNAGNTIPFVVEREGAEVTLTITPKSVDGVGKIGVYPEERTEYRDLGVGGSIWAGVEHTYTLAAANVKAVGQMIAGSRSSDQLSGPIGIAVMSRSVVERGLGGFVEFTALISVALGLINLVPIPPLDGGHLLYNGLEALFRRPLKPRVQQIGASVGFTLVIALMVWVTAKDIIGLAS